MGTRNHSVVMLHASASSARQWRSLAAALAPRFRVYAVDLYGHGERAPWGDARPLALADDAALAAPLLLRSDSVHLVGHSYGGAVALKLAATYPRLVRSVTLYEPVMFRWLADAGAAEVGDVRAIAESISDRLASGAAFDAAQAFIDFWSGHGTWQAMPAPRQAALAACMPSVARHFRATFDEALTLRDVARLPVRMMFVAGGRTVPAMRRFAQAVRVALPAARHSCMEEAGHMGPITHADEFAAQVLAFVDREEASIAA